MSVLVLAVLALVVVAAAVLLLGLVIPPVVRALVDRPTAAELEPAPPSWQPPAVAETKDGMTEADYAAINALERATGQEVTDYSVEVAVLRARERPAVRALLTLRDAVAATPTRDAAAAAAAYGYLSAIEEMIELERGNIALVTHADQARARFQAAKQQFTAYEQHGPADG